MTLRLSVFWFLYFAGLGAYFPYYGLYLRQDCGLSESQVGLVLGAVPLVGLFTQALWGRLADRTGSRRGLLAACVLGVAIAHGVLGLVSGFGALLAATCLLAAFSTSVLPQAMAVSLAAQAESRGSAFGFVRMWGTLGFLASVVAFPWLTPRLDQLPGLPWHGTGWLFPIASCASLLALGGALALPSTAAMQLRSARGDTRRLLRHPPVRRLLWLIFFAHLMMQGPINVFPLLIASRGGDAASISHMWIFMLLLEIPLIGFSGPTLRRFGARNLLRVGLLAEGLRWTVCALTSDLTVVTAMQLMHGVSVAGVLIGGPLYLEQAVPESLRSTGQTLVSSVGYGLGAIVSIPVAGWLFETAGAAVPYGIAGVGTLVLGLLVPSVLPVPHRPEAGGGAS